MNQLHHVVEKSPPETWHACGTAMVLARVGSSIDGLSEQEAAHRLAAHGPNELKEGRRSGPMRILGDQFKTLITWVLVAAGAFSGVVGETADAIAIFALVILNAIIGFYQEYKAEKSIAALDKLTVPRATVRREGQVMSLPAPSIVKGDVLVFESGDLVTADARLLVTASLRCVEAALTGESQPVAKDASILEKADVALGDRRNMVFMGTSIAAGTGEAVVVATGMESELGRIAGLIDEAGADAETPLQRRLDVVGSGLIWAALGIVALLFGLGLLRGTRPYDLFMTSISLAVAAIPEGLPAVVTVALSLGVMRMARHRALVRRLAAVETLGSTSVICTDKTGTLTLGEMSVRALYVAGETYDVTGEGYGPGGEVRFGGKKAAVAHAAPLLELATVLLACNNAHLVQGHGSWSVVGDPTEGALLVAAAKAGGHRDRVEKRLPKQYEIPFDSDRKRSAVVRTMTDGGLRAFVNGAPGPLLDRCTHLYTSDGVRLLGPGDRKRILDETSTMATRALRVLGSAFRDLDGPSPGQLSAAQIETDLTFVGLTGMYDPPRPEGREAIMRCREAGIRVVMITGDHPRTASAIAGELGISSGDSAVTGADLDRLTEAELARRVVDTSVYARVTAAHKLRIVRALKAGGAVVAMTGDGVNDAPAIKSADIGIAMGRTGTEVTKQAADMIITDDNFATIVTAIREGRGIYDNIRKTLQYLLAGNTGELLLMAICVMIGLPSPLLPIHLLWINLVTDGLPAFCLAADPIDPQVMRRHPRPRSTRLIDRSFLRTMALTGVLTAGVAFVVYIYVLRSGTLEEARTAAFAALVYAELLRSFGVRSETRPIWRTAIYANVYLLIVVGISIGLQVLSQHSAILGGFLKTTSLSFSDSFLLLALGAIPLVVLEVVKVARNALRQRRHST